MAIVPQQTGILLARDLAVVGPDYSQDEMSCDIPGAGDGPGTRIQLRLTWGERIAHTLISVYDLPGYWVKNPKPQQPARDPDDQRRIEAAWRW